MGLSALSQHMGLEKAWLVQGVRALAGHLCTDARTKDCKTYPKPCNQHFETDIPFLCVQSASEFKLVQYRSAVT